PLAAELVLEGLDDISRWRHEAFLVALAEDTKVCFGEGEIFELELKNFAGAQAIQQHQGHDGQIAKGAEAFPETGDLVGGKRNYQAAGLAESQSGRDTAMRPAVAER